MFKKSSIFFSFLLLCSVSCKTSFPSAPGQYSISILLDYDYNEVNNVISICTPLQILHHEVMNQPATDKLLVALRFINNDEEVIEKVRQELLNIRPVLTVQINKSYR